MPNRADISSILISAAALSVAMPAVASAEDGWVVGGNEEHPVHIEHTVAAATLQFYAEYDADDAEYDLSVHIRVAPCDEDGATSIEVRNGVFPYDDTAEERARLVRRFMESAVENAQNGCALPDDFAQRILKGFGPAYREADAMMIEAGILPLPDPFAFFDEPNPAPAQETESQ
ncbi:hypothetical protein [Croceicoccus sediminis]|uniref:hypothetical protein n=1 Tax=Croceicoccus sediminis TaxID=2571150 RepID=UPI0011820E30|nr:hypothetical protein [Croceicoccus sediminis]